MANILKIVVEPIVKSNDHQARLLIDGKDWLGNEYAGLDPQMLLKQLHIASGKVIVGCCWCGAVGCSDVLVDVARSKNLVTWREAEDRNLTFEIAQYDAEVMRFSQDRSWETIGRTAEREIERFFRGTMIKRGFVFDWASTRVQQGFITLSYSKPSSQGPHQRLLKFDWDGVSVESAMLGAKLFRAQRFPHLPRIDEPDF